MRRVGDQSVEQIQKKQYLPESENKVEIIFV